MSYSISTLLTPNLQDVFGENDPARRRSAINEIFNEDGVFYDPSKRVYRGRVEIDRIAGELRATHLSHSLRSRTCRRTWVDHSLIVLLWPRPGSHPNARLELRP
jgi:hypothetical protein